MAKGKETAPSEFNRFVRDIGIRAFDNFAQRLGEPSAPPSEPVTKLRAGANTAFQKLASYWSTMGPEEKQKFFDQIINAAQVVAAAAPAVVVGWKNKKAKKAKKQGAPRSEALAAAEASLPDKSKAKKAKDKSDKKSGAKKR